MWENIQRALSDGVALVATFVPKLLLFLVIMLVGWLIAKALRKLVSAVLTKVGFDRLVERGGIGQALARSSYDAGGLIAALVYYAILLITLQIAFGAFGSNPVSELLAGIVAYLPRIIVAIVIVVIAAAIANAVRTLVSGAMSGLSYGRVVANIASVFIIGLGVIAALSQVGIAVEVTLPVLITVLATVGGILVVGVGGGLIAPMRQRWERVLTKAEEEAPKAQAANAQAANAQAANAQAANAQAANAQAANAQTANAQTANAQTEPMPGTANGQGAYVASEPGAAWPGQP